MDGGGQLILTVLGTDLVNVGFLPSFLRSLALTHDRCKRGGAMPQQQP